MFAQFEIGLCYQRGLGVDVDLGKARAWYEKAAKNGNTVAYTPLGKMLINGEGGKVEKSKGLQYLKKAASEGDEEAVQVLKKMQQDRSASTASTQRRTN